MSTILIEIMKQYRLIYIFFLIIGISSQAFGQKKVWIKFGDQSMQVHDAYSASKFYEKALAGDSTDLAVKYKLAKAFMAYQNFPKALPICLEILKLRSKEEFMFIHHDLGIIYKHQGDFESAEKHFRSFVKRGDKGSFEYLSAKNELANFKKVTELIQDTLKVKVNNLPGTVNTGASEFSPVLLNDSVLLFSSLRATSVLEDGTIKDLDYTAAIYRANRKDSLWYAGAELSAKDSKEKSVANGSFNDDKSEFYFSVCETFGVCKIYKGMVLNDSLTQYEELPAPVNLPEVSSTHPHFFEVNGKKALVFSSNRPGGQGGMDLWVSNFRGKWTTPKNLGKSVNTMGNELTPFYEADSSKLFFSSDWHYNIGGFDIFSVKGEFPSSWDTVVNMGIPYNSPLNDLYYVQKNEEEGFLTSSREGSKTEKDAPCCNDIYDFKKEKEIVKQVRKSKMFSSLYRLPVKVYFHNDRPNVDSWDTLTNLNYDTTYARYTPRYQEYRKEFSAQFKGGEVELAKLAIDTFFNDFLYKGHRDLMEFTSKLRQELEEGRSVQVLLKGFASPLTKSDYNVNLSRRRISSVVNFLREYDDGVLKQYMGGSDSAGVKLSFVQNPNGEYMAQKGVSDDYYDVRNSIFNPNAAMERKVELSARLTYQKEVPVFTLDSEVDTLVLKKAGVNAMLLLHNGSSDDISVGKVLVDGVVFDAQGFILEKNELSELEIPVSDKDELLLELYSNDLKELGKLLIILE